MTEGSWESMDCKLLYVGNYTQQIVSYRQTHTYRAFPIIILREGGFFRVSSPSSIRVIALKKLIKKYLPSTGKKFPFPLRVASSSFPLGIFAVSSLSWYQVYLCPVETMYLSDEKSITDEKR